MMGNFCFANETMGFRMKQRNEKQPALNIGGCLSIGEMLSPWQQKSAK
jgi:hypothetical protein